jgi:hypothetical protein
MEWWHTANLIATLVNIHRDKNKPAQDPSKFHPFAKKKPARQATPEEIAKLLGPDWHTVST